ncbi:MAG: efflux RND transporter periplasmic adaptor subunit [Vulcanimicrobiaceae bacterium]
MKVAILPMSALLGLGLIGGCAARSPGQSPPASASDIVPVRVASVRLHAFGKTVDLSGSLTALHSVTVGAASPGRIVAVNVRVGERVAAGQVIAEVDAAQYSAQLSQAQAGVAAANDGTLAAQARLTAARSAYTLAHVTATRMAHLYAQGAISKQHFDEMQASLAAAQAGVAGAQAGVQAASSMSSEARAGVDVAAVPFRNATIVAPFSGVITNKFVQRGAVVGPGSPVARLEDPSRLELDVAVPDRDAAALTLGSRVAVRVDSAGSSLRYGRVRAVVPSGNPALRSAMVKISVSSSAGLLPGMFARVRLVGAAHRLAAVPFSAIATRAGQTGVFVVSRSTARFIPVRTGALAAGLIAVGPSRYLPVGARVAISGVARLTDGTSVTIVQ